MTSFTDLLFGLNSEQAGIYAHVIHSASEQMLYLYTQRKTIQGVWNWCFCSHEGADIWFFHFKHA